MGAGPVGLMLAALLDSRFGARINVTLLDAGAVPRWRAGALDLRVYALSRASQRLFERIELWRELRERVSPYRRMRVWQGEDPAGIASLEFDAADLGEPDLGCIAEDALLRVALYERLVERTHVSLRFGVRLARVEVGARAVTVYTQSGDTLRASLLVGADGSASQVRAALALPVVSRSYGQAALVAHVASEKPHQETAWQRFLPRGPLALLPLLDGRSSVVWSTDIDHAERLLAASDEIFERELHAASLGVLGQLSDVSQRARFVLKAQHAGAYCRERVALIGDAAHTVHPLAGQGLNLGLLDAAALADVIEEATRERQDPGDMRSLARYERRRKGENLKMLLAFDALNTLFRLPSPIAALPGLGLGCVGASPFLKRMLGRRALGVAGPLPSAARAVGS